MRYCVDMTDWNVTITEDKYQKAVYLLRNMIRGNKNSWIDSDSIKRSLECLDLERALIDVLSEWGYDFLLGVDGRSIFLDKRTRETWGDDKRLWRTLAPVIRRGGYIEFLGEEASRWKYEFGDERFQKLTGATQWV